MQQQSALQQALRAMKARAITPEKSVELREDHDYHALTNKCINISIDDLDLDQGLVSEWLSPEEVLLSLEEDDLWTDVWTESNF